ncbi:efflux RND transporter permease subunit [Psychrobium sp. MM17-31]|uniref:efflux RND transporter permease subunit n=1 Tax=Psychrobium sp. MM17-31 TaxID=2917758 RepID=UPI001EF48C2A|nr:efflux RND transporter permease subunit [Psychrobium sp. MM17-31]MCG7531064.1 efflux RND transporter permease subunit [Psychrobium sp. MM17-31]
MNNQTNRHDDKSLFTGPIAWFMQNPVAANLLMVSILVIGFFSLQGLRIQGFPSIDANTVMIDVSFDSGSAKQTEEGIAIKIEQALQGLNGIKEIRSTSSLSGANIVVEKEEDYDLSLLTKEVKNKVDGIYGLPDTAEKPIITQQKMEEHALWINLYGGDTQQALQKVARQFEDALLRLPAVNSIERTGWKTPEISIEVNELQLQALNLTISDIAQVIAAESVSENGGQLRSSDGIILLKADKQGYIKRDFANILVKTLANGSEVRLGDITTIKDVYAEYPKVLSRYQGQRAINFKVMVNEGADILAIAKDAKRLTQQWQSEGLLPQNMQLATMWDRSQFMQDRLLLLAKNGLVGVFLVMLVLGIFLNLKVAFWVGMGIPVCFAGAFILLGDNFLNMTLNELTTFGFIIVLGILVDDAVVVGESIYSHRQRDGNNLAASIRGVKSIAAPTLFGLLTTVAAFYPMSFIEGMLGKVFSMFALVAVACLIFSLIESKLILPAHLAHVNTIQPAKPNWFMAAISWIQQLANRLISTFNSRYYQPAIRTALHFRYLTLSGFIAIFIVVVGMIPAGKVGFVFFPNIVREVVEVRYSTEMGVGYHVSHAMARDVETAVTTLNQQWIDSKQSDGPVIASMLTQVLNETDGYLALELNGDPQRTVTAEVVGNELRALLPKPEGIRQLKIISSEENVDGFNLKILADTREEIGVMNDSVIEFMQNIGGVTDIETDLLKGQPQLEFELTAAGRSLGLTTASLTQQIRQAFFGAEVQRVQRGKDQVKVFVRYDAQKRRDTTDLESARIRTPSGVIVPLSLVATQKRVYTIKDIKHVNTRQAVTITANLDKAVISADRLMNAVDEQLLQGLLAKYPNAEVLIGGESAEEEKTVNSMIKIFALSLFLIYALVAIPLKSYTQPIIIMSAIPFGILGAILGHWIIGLPISILSILGILALSGVVVNNSLLLVDRFNKLRLQEHALMSAITQACSDRLRAIILTSLTTYAGLASLLQETSEQAMYLIPAAASLAYGILFSTVITLVLVPVLLVIFDDVKQVKRKLFSVAASNMETAK